MGFKPDLPVVPVSAGRRHTTLNEMMKVRIVETGAKLPCR